MIILYIYYYSDFFFYELPRYTLGLLPHYYLIVLSKMDF